MFQVLNECTIFVQFAPMQCIIELKSSLSGWRFSDRLPPDFIVPVFIILGYFVIQRLLIIHFFDNDQSLNFYRSWAGLVFGSIVSALINEDGVLKIEIADSLLSVNSVPGSNFTLERFRDLAQKAIHELYQDQQQKQHWERWLENARKKTEWKRD